MVRTHYMLELSLRLRFVAVLGFLLVSSFCRASDEIAQVVHSSKDGRHQFEYTFVVPEDGSMERAEELVDRAYHEGVLPTRAPRETAVFYDSTRKLSSHTSIFGGPVSFSKNVRGILQKTKGFVQEKRRGLILGFVRWVINGAVAGVYLMQFHNVPPTFAFSAAYSFSLFTTYAPQVFNENFQRWVSLSGLRGRGPRPSGLLQATAKTGLFYGATIFVAQMIALSFDPMTYTSFAAGAIDISVKALKGVLGQGGLEMLNARFTLEQKNKYPDRADALQARGDVRSLVISVGMSSIIFAGMAGFAAAELTTWFLAVPGLYLVSRIYRFEGPEIVRWFQRFSSRLLEPIRRPALRCQRALQGG